MKRFFGALAFVLAGGAVQAQSVAELASEGLVMLNSHYDAERGVVVFLMGDLQGAPLFVCQTRFNVTENDDFDQCRKLR